MNTYFALRLAAVFFLGIVNAQPPSDAEAKEKLVGDWTIELRKGAVVLKGEQQNRADGTFTVTMDVGARGKKYHLICSGTWEVKDGVLVEKITDSSAPEMIKPGHETKDTILETTEQTYRTRTESGGIEEYFRK